MEFWVGTFTGSTFTDSTPITNLTVGSQTGGSIQRAITGTACVAFITDALPAVAESMSSTKLVVGAITVEVVALTVSTAVDLIWIFPLLTLTSATDTVSIVAAQVRIVVYPAGCIPVFKLNFVCAALTNLSDTSLIAFAGTTFEGPVAMVASLTVGYSSFGALTAADEAEEQLDLLGEAQRPDRDHRRPGLGHTLLGLHGNLERNLISNGNVGALLAVLVSPHHAILTGGLVGDGNALWKGSVLQNHLRGQRIVNVADEFDDVGGVGGKSSHGRFRDKILQLLIDGLELLCHCEDRLDVVLAQFLD